MLKLSQIIAESIEAAARAAKEGRYPLHIEPANLDSLEHFKAFCKSIPYLGHYPKPIVRRRGYRLTFQEIAVDTVIQYPYKWFFVDSSGWTSGGEAALSGEEFRQLLLKLCAKDNYLYALGIAEVGQFQVQVALYTSTYAKDTVRETPPVNAVKQHNYST
jgi:hypothetical protein